MNVLQLLAEKGTIKQDDILVIADEARAAKVSVEVALGKRGVSPEDILKVASEKYSIPYRVLPATPVSHVVLQYVPEESARHYRIVPFAVEDGVLLVGVVDPDNIEAMDALQFISGRLGMPFKVFLVSEADFNKILEEYESLSGEVGEALSELEGSLTEEAAQTRAKRDKEKDEIPEPTIKADAPVTKIVATVLRYAVEGGASDIHIEPTPEKTRVRFRMDGELHTSLELPEKVHPAVVARIKILSQMRLDEKRKPQDGRFSATVEGRRIDFRVSTFPTEYGEKVVMRILDRSKEAVTLESVGFSNDNLDAIREIVKAPYGIVLISGPTGSGKSTTLFAMLSELDKETRNVVSVEDPVEYEIPGVSQSQVHPEIGYTFASGLRSILRQDPNVIMVGEIRDKETAQLAIQAALTGHLVFSTIHTNTAAGVIPRLVDMGVDPYLIAPTLIAAIGQRLVRKLCPGAGEKMPISESVQVRLQKEFEDLPADAKKKLPPFKHFYKAKPTADCPNGTRGRTGVFEIMKITPEMEHIILTSPIEEKVYEAARAAGMFTMQDDAIIKALAGEIPFEEVNALGGMLLEDEDSAAPVYGNVQNISG
ncbi:MAG: type IV pilus assembly protein PilB [Parcubacteria bacterium C7867-001]|nr:MAG: type IV pilus assembly protein PilB [Parcubacteria bacterium C7867-001]